MALLLLTLEGCGTTIHDHTFCSPIPGNLGAACDNFLTHKPVTLNQTDWEALQASWMAKGWAIEVTESDAVGNLKLEIEQLCSKTTCDEDTSNTVQALVQTLSRMQETATRARSLNLSMSQ